MPTIIRHRRGLRALSLPLAIVAAVSALAACAPESPDEPDSAAADEGVFLNAGFEHADPKGLPLAWTIEADATKVSVSLSDDVAREGERSLRVELAEGAEAYLYTPLFFDDRCVGQVDSSAQVLTDGKAGAALFLLEPGGGIRMGEAAAASDDWRPITVSDAVAEDGCLASDLLIGLHLTGPGTVHVDGLELAVDHPGYRIASEPPEPRTFSIGPDSERLVAVESTDPSHAGDDLVGFDAMLGDARVVGLGDNSHGAKAIFELKHRLIRRLVTEHGFTHFALEMPAGPAEIVDAYVTGTETDAEMTTDRALAALSYPAWRSEEMWALIEWFREYNQKAAEPVRVHGLDLPQEAMEGRSLDEAMAETVLAIGEEDASPGVVVWADNTHITKYGNTMGGDLARELGDGYLAVGFTFGDGQYSAYGPELAYAAQPAYPGTHEWALGQLAPEDLLLDIRGLPADHPLNDALGFRYIGSSPQPFNQFHPHRLPEHFDVVGYLEETKATSFIEPPAF